MIYIVVPCYNVENYLAQCLESILAQDRGDFEIVAVNDASTDNTLGVLKEFEKRDSRIKVIDAEHGGPSITRNRALDYIESHGDKQQDLICFVDSDDWIEPDYISTLAGMMEDDVALAAIGLKRERRTDKHISQKPEKVVSMDGASAVKQLFGDKTIRGYMPNKMIKLKFLQGMRFDEVRMCEDTLFYFGYLTSLPRGVRVTSSSKILYHYEVNKLSLTRRVYTPKKLQWLQVANKMTKRNNDFEGLRGYINAWQFLMCIDTLLYGKSVDKNLRKELKAYAKSLKNDFMNIRHEFCGYRKYAHIILWAL